MSDRIKLAPSRLSMKKYRVGDGDAGVLATIKLMQSIVVGPEGVGSPAVRASAIAAVAGTSRGMDEITAVFQWVKDEIEFRGEYSETLQTPLVTLQLGAGDCDDHSTLLAALLQSIGFDTRFNTISTGGENDEFSHVYVEVLEKKTRQWIALDTTVRSSWPGWQPKYFRSQVRESNPAAVRNGGGMVGTLLAIGALVVAGNWISDRVKG